MDSSPIFLHRYVAVLDALSFLQKRDGDAWTGARMLEQLTAIPGDTVLTFDPRVELEWVAGVCAPPVPAVQRVMQPEPAALVAGEAARCLVAGVLARSPEEADLGEVMGDLRVRDAGNVERAVRFPGQCEAGEPIMIGDALSWVEVCVTRDWLAARLALKSPS